MIMKLTVYDKSNSHPALTYKGKRIITVCRDGSMYLSRILSRELSLHAGNSCVSPGTKTGPRTGTCSSRMTRTASRSGTTPRCARFSNSFIAGMILECGKGREMRRFHGGERAGECGRQICYQIILDNPIPKGVSVRTTGTK